jgi:acetyl-CoA carboxylase/biotin carboxylase 1
MSDLTYVVHSKVEPLRFGLMSSFNDVDSLTSGFGRLLGMFPSFSEADFAEKHGKEANHPHVLNVALRAFGDDDTRDETLIEKFLSISNEHSDKLFSKGIRRVTFVVCRQGQYPVRIHH